MTTPKNTPRLKLPIVSDRVYRMRDGEICYIGESKSDAKAEAGKLSWVHFRTYQENTGVYQDEDYFNSVYDMIEGPFEWDELKGEWVLDTKTFGESSVPKRFDYVFSFVSKSGISQETHGGMSEDDIENIVNEVFNTKPNLVTVDIYKKHASYSRVTKIERTDV